MAEKNNFKCPICNDELAQDKIGRGFVRHKTKPDCPCKGERDKPNKSEAKGRM
jgi:hypothetical protein